MTDSSRDSLLKQIEIHEKFIFDSLHNDRINFELIAFKILELKKAAKILEPYDDMCLNKFNSIKERL